MAEIPTKKQGNPSPSDEPNGHRMVLPSIGKDGRPLISEEEALGEIQKVDGMAGATGKGVWVAIGRSLARLKQEVSVQQTKKRTARTEKNSFAKTLAEERKKTKAQSSEIEDLQSTTRRQFLILVAETTALAAIGYKFWKDSKNPSHPQQQSPGHVPNVPKECQPVDERRPELFKKMTAFETVLNEGLRYWDPQSGTWKDKLLSPFKVSEYLLGDKFIYTGIDEKLSSGPDTQNVHNFAIMGDMSRHYGRNGNHCDAYKTTTLSDAINNLLDYQKLTDANIRGWIVFTYKYSFGVDLDATQIGLKRDPRTQKVTEVSYDIPSTTPNEVRLKIPKTVEDFTPAEKGGNITQVQKTLPLVGANNRLLLHSGISPMHDLRVPVSYMEADKNIDLHMPGAEWKIQTADIAMCVNWYRNRLKTTREKMVTGVVKGRNVASKSLQPYIYENDPFARDLANFLTRDAKTDAEKIQRITSFVQSLRYIWENNSDEDRPILITLFNEGSDCNNLTMAWVSMMHALKLDYAILYSSDAKDEGHTMGGIPEDTAPPELKARSRYRTIFPVELTGKWEIGQVDPPPGHSIYASEGVRFPKESPEKIPEQKK